MSPDPNDILLDYRTWLYKTATGILRPGHPYLDDLAQEGQIAMWRALGTYRADCGSLPSWLTRKARWRMLEVVKRDWNWTGRPSRRDGRNRVIPLTEIPVSPDVLYDLQVN